MNRIKEIIKEKGTTIDELAKEIGLNRVTLSRQINGTANVVSYERIASALSVPMWQLFASVDDVSRDISSSVIECPHCHKRFKLVQVD